MSLLKKGTKRDFAYQEGKTTPPRCDKCQYFVEDGRCRLVKGIIDGVNGSCSFWVGGEINKSNSFHAEFTKEQAGYVEFPKGPRCGTCYFYLDPHLCKLVKGDINPKIGCCSAWKK